MLGNAIGAALAPTKEANLADTITVCSDEELAAGEMRIVETPGSRKVGVFRCEGGELMAIEDRCSHDDGPLAEGEFDSASCIVECPRHGSSFDLRTGRPRSLPAFRPVETFSVRVEDGQVKLEV
ncbi:MAG: non-heme iron oxygenase ferredoxin subunit [Solirubrobacterales bacterium]|nr:non-heme iron oxygenase ferredoxin subunit [Solirubrobacterales bacterium]